MSKKSVEKRVQKKRERERQERQRRRRKKVLAAWTGGAAVTAVLAVLLVLVWPDGGTKQQAEACTTPGPATVGQKSFEQPPCMTIDTAKTYEATIATSKGDITVRLYDDDAPKTVNNFVFLARQKFYDGLTFHRVIPDFMIQGGDPEGTGLGGPGYTFADEREKAKRFDKPGLLAMANAGVDTNGSQFFITDSATGASHLNANPVDPAQSYHTIFGEVIDGLEVVRAIARVQTGEENKPVEPVTITTITITER